MKERQEERLSPFPTIGKGFGKRFEAPSYEEGVGDDGKLQGFTLHKKINPIKKVFMKIFKKNIPADKIGNFILTVITAFVSTFFMQSCGLC